MQQLTLTYLTPFFNVVTAVLSSPHANKLLLWDVANTSLKSNYNTREMSQVEKGDATLVKNTITHHALDNRFQVNRKSTGSYSNKRPIVARGGYRWVLFAACWDQQWVSIGIFNYLLFGQ